MKDETPAYPSPLEDADNGPFLEAWREGRLHLQECRACGKSVFYPRPMCPHCWSAELVWRPSRGIGEIVSFSRIERPNHEAFAAEVPVVLAEIRLEEGATILARVLGDHARVQAGSAVELVTSGWKRHRYPLPIFRLRSSGPDQDG